MDLMKKITVVLLFLMIGCASQQIRTQPNGVIYISEIVTAQGTGENKTLLSAFHPDGTKVKELEINGLMARMSPDQSQLVYIQLNNEPNRSPWDLVLADSNGNKIKMLQFLTKEAKGNKFVQDIAWSPDGSKLSILMIGNEFKRGHIKGFQIFAFGFDPKAEKTLQMHKEFCPSENDPCYYSINWFKDSRRLLLYGSSGIRIIDLENQESQSIVNYPARAHLSSNDDKLIAITAMPQKDAASNIGAYDLRTGILGIQMPIDFYPQRSVASRDGSAILLQGKPSQTSDIFKIELMNRQISKLETTDLTLLPMTFSPADNRLVACMGGSSFDGYGIFNLKSGKFLYLKNFAENSPRGKKVVLSILLNRIDWFRSELPANH
jgi:WD40 repeat protein